MRLEFDDNIAALASPPGPAARGIIRISGDTVVDFVQSVFEPRDSPISRSCAVRYSGSIDPPQLGNLPADVYLWPTKKSYTGQPMAEFHLLGSPPILECVLDFLYERGVRPARQGEFTLRAFLAGRIDLVQAEAVLGVIDAQDHEELQLALEQLAGGISGQIAQMRVELIDLLSDLEAGLDFADEDIEFVDRQDVIDRLQTHATNLEQLLQQSDERMQSSTRRRVVIGGLPNAGKSSLFNCLIERDAAIVSQIEGTTRDYLSTVLDMDGLACELIDTAGWESTTKDQHAANIPELAQDHRSQQFDRADLIVWCSALDAADEDQQLYESVAYGSVPVVRIYTKSDLQHTRMREPSITVSSHSGEEIESLKSTIRQYLERPQTGERAMLGSTAARCRSSLSQAFNAMQQAKSTAEIGEGDELIAFEIRDAMDHLAQILGAVYTDDILDQIFGKFCIGK